MRKPIIAGNWKMNKTIGEAVELVEKLWELVKEIDDVEMVLCPPYVALEAVKKRLEGTNIELGAQDVFWKDSGAYTGQVSPVMLKDVGCKYVIIGHSETRGRFGKPDAELTDELLKHFGETEESINMKVKAALKNELIPIICVGENLAERSADKTDTVVRTHLEGALKDLTAEQVSSLVVAYEPVWAIGTGEVCEAKEANRVIGLIRSIVSEKLGPESAEKIRILYGGSVTSENISNIMKEKEIDGALVGGASLKAEEFARIIKLTSEVKKYNPTTD